MINVDFENCSFRGTEIGVTSFGDVHFYSSKIDSNSSTITDEIMSFRNCIFLNRNETVKEGVIEVLNKDSEVRFTRAIFDACHFRGLIRPQWFRDCFFSGCVFPTTIDSLSLVSSGNGITDNFIQNDEFSY